jgi:hypothetical protein
MGKGTKPKINVDNPACITVSRVHNYSIEDACTSPNLDNKFSLLKRIYHTNLNIRRTFQTFFPVEKLRYILNLTNVHLSNFFPKTHIQKLDVS